MIIQTQILNEIKPASKFRIKIIIKENQQNIENNSDDFTKFYFKIIIYLFIYL